jgi:di/tricarboxylate transporter
MEPFSIFEVSILGAIIVVWGMAYLYFIGRHLLPERDSLANMLSGSRGKMKFFTEAVVPPDSNLIGREVLDVQLFKREGVRLIDVVRGDTSLRHALEGVALEVGDRIVLRSQISELLSLQRDKSLKRVNQVSAVETTTVETLITPGCKMVGRSLVSMRLRRRYGIYVLAVHRRNQNLGQKINDLVVRVGDTLLIEGAPADIQRLAADMDMGDVSKPTERAYHRSHAPIALIAMFSIVILAAFGVAPILMLSVVSVAVVLVTRCIDAEEAFSFVDTRLLTLIFSMLAVGASLQASGAVAMIVGWIAPLLDGLPIFFVIWSIYLMTSVLTELVSNNAVAVVVTPIAIALGQQMGLDPRGLVVAVMVAASASFATPIGYQTNTMVYGPGGYKFTDYMKVGIPLNISIGLLSSAVIPFLWPL